MDLEIFRRVNWRTGLVLLFVALVIIGTIVMVVSMKNGNVGGSDSESQNKPQATTTQSNATSVVTTNDAGNIGVISIADLGAKIVLRGMIIAYNSSNAPDGWALCDGTRGTPDLRGRFILGSGSGPSLTARTLGAKGGAETVALKTEEMPPHIHPVDYMELWIAGGNHKRVALSIMQGPGAIDIGTRKVLYPEGGKLTPDALSKDHDPPIVKRGEEKYGHYIEEYAVVPHENMPPFYVLTYIMKI